MITFLSYLQHKLFLRKLPGDGHIFNTSNSVTATIYRNTSVLHIHGHSASTGCNKLIEEISV